MITVVTGKILDGYHGIGRLPSEAPAEANSGMTFAIVITTSVLGLAIGGIVELVRCRELKWWEQPTT